MLTNDILGEFDGAKDKKILFKKIKINQSKKKIGFALFLKNSLLNNKFFPYNQTST